MAVQRAVPGRASGPTVTGDWLDRLFRPVWAGAWPITLRVFVLSQALAHFPRALRIADAYAAPDMLFVSGPWRLSQWVSWSVPTAWALWIIGLAGLLMAFLGGRLARPGLVVYLLGAWALLAQEALNVKAHDRLALWVAMALLCAPIQESGLASKSRSPAARWVLIVLFSAIYGSTGLVKAWYEPAWFEGTALGSHLVHQFHGGGRLAVWFSGKWVLTAVAGWWTLLFELAFPIAIWFRRSNPWILLMGAAFHVGILLLMQVGPFSWVALSAYPVLLHPEVARRFWCRVTGRRDEPAAPDQEEVRSG